MVLSACVVGCGSHGISAGTPTKPVGEPLVFRLTGGESAVSNSDARYLLVFKLNRTPTVRRKFSVDGGIVDDHGDFGVAGYAVGDNGDVGAMSSGDCFTGTIESPAGDDADEQVRRLDRIALGGRVEVSLRPLTPSKTSGRLVPGRKYIFHPRLRRARHELSIGQADERDRAQLQSIGCG
jgi:hypothetical protein